MSELMEYQEYPVSRDLQPYIQCYWTTSSSSIDLDLQDRTRRILPDGCIDLMFNPEGWGTYHGGNQELSCRSTKMLLGVQQGPIFLRSMGQVEAIAIRFKPGAAKAFLGIDVHELADTMLCLSDISSKLFRSFSTQLFSKRCKTDQKISMLEKSLRQMLRPVPQVVQFATAMLEQNPEGIEALSKNLRISRQHLARLFKVHVGLKPKYLARVFRFNAALRSLQDNPGLPGTHLATDLGYFDQAHFISEFLHFSGTTPQAFTRMQFDQFHFYNTKDCRFAKAQR